MKMKNLVALTSAVVLTLTLAPTAFAADRTDDMTVGNENTTIDTNGNSVTTKDYSGIVEAGDSFNADTVIKATVNSPKAKVISVTLPSTMSMAVGTKYKTGTQTVVYDEATTHTVAASVKNSSKDCKVDISVAKVAATPVGALPTLMLKLMPTSANATSVATEGVNLLTSTVNQNLITGLTSLNDEGSGAAGEATLALATGMTDNTSVLDSLVGQSTTITTTLKVAASAQIS